MQNTEPTAAAAHISDRSPKAASSREQIASLQSLRGAAVLIIIALHVMITEKKYSVDERFLSDHLMLFGCGVDLFFVISGFIMTTISFSQFQQPGGVSRFIYNRVSRIYPLYWVYSACALAVYFVKPTMVNDAHGHQVNILASLFLLPQEREPLIQVGWTLVYEVYFYLTFSLMLLTKERHFIKLLLLWGGLGALGNFLCRQVLDVGFVPALFLIFSPFIFEFIGGCLIAKAIHSGHRRYGGAAVLAGLLWFVVVAGPYYRELWEFPSGWFRVFFFGVPAIAVIYGAVALEFSSGKVLLPQLRGVGDASYSLYLSHPFVLAALGRVWSTFSTPGIVDNVVWVTGVSLIILCTGMLSYRYIELPLLQATRRFKAQLAGVGRKQLRDMDKRQYLLGRLEEATKVRQLSKQQRLRRYPLLTIKNAILGRSIRTIFGARYALQRKTRTFFDQDILVSIPPFEDIWLYGASQDEAETRLTKFLILNVNEGETIFDIGANLGYYSLLGAHLVGETGKVLAFEPSPAITGVLRKNVGQLRQVQIVEKAAGRTEGTINFYVGPGKYVANSTMNPENLRESGFSHLHQFHPITVETICLDSFCASHHFWPSLVKIDVEGAEEEVLLGAQALLARQAPLIAMEIWFNPFTETYRRAVALLAGQGFIPFAINHDGSLTALRTDSLERDWQAWRRTSRQNDLDNLIFRKLP